MFQFEGKVAVITGAASGFGRAFAEKGATLGMKLVLADVDGAALAQAVEALRAAGADAIGVPTDVSDAAEVDALALAALDAFGKIHLLFNNAGVGVRRQCDGCRARRAGVHANHAAAERTGAYRQYGFGGGAPVAAGDGDLQRL